MAHAARIENGIVKQVIVVPDDLGGDENDAAIKQFVNGIGLEGHWIRTSYNASVNGFRGAYAGIGYTFNGDEFIPPAAPEPETEPAP